MATLVTVAGPADAATAHRDGGCVSQLVAQYGAPGLQVDAIKQATPAPGRLVATVAHEPIDACNLGG